MARVTANQINMWGRASTDGQEPQRVDLWYVDWRNVVNGLSDVLNVQLPNIETYYVQSVSFPELKVKPEVFRRDSRSYNMPSFDEPLDSCRMTFIVDARSIRERSHIYYFLDAWRRAVRAGRGSMSSEDSLTLNTRYRIDYKFPVWVFLLKGGDISKLASFNADIKEFAAIERDIAQTSSLDPTSDLFNPSTAIDYVAGSPLDPSWASTQQAVLEARLASKRLRNPTLAEAIDPGLDVSALYVLEGTWLGGFKLNELTYKESGTLTIEATFYPEDIRDEAQASAIPRVSFE